MTPNPPTNNPAIREVYTWFGATTLDASNLEQDFLLILILAARMKDPTVSVDTLETLDTHLAKKTMGVLLNQLHVALGLPDVTRTRLNVALERRNFLIHHFWRDNIQSLGSPAGCRTLCEQLASLSLVFREALGHTSGIIAALGSLVGVSREKAAAEAALLWTHEL